jgi:O-antigen/teichoic acid export membrane protein
VFKIASLVKASTTSPSARPDRSVLVAAKGSGIVFTGSLLQYAVRFVSGIVLARFLGAEQYGLYNLSLTVITVVSGLTLLGLTLALVRYVSLLASRQDTAGLWGALQIGIGLPIILSLLVGVGLYFLADPVAERLFHEPRLAPLLRLGSLIIPFLALSNLTAAATQGFKEMQYTVIAQYISQPVVKLVMLAVLAITGLNAAKALTAFTAAVVVASVMLLYFLNKLFPLKRPLLEARRDARGMLRFAVPIYLSNLIGTFGGNVKTVLLGALNNVTNVGVFAVANQINAIGQMFHACIVTASAPVVSELYDRGEWRQMGHFYKTMTKWTFTLNLPLFLIVLLFPVPILSIFGQSFEGGATALTILAWGNLVNAGTGICGVLLDMTGNASLKLVNSLVVFALALGLNILLIPSWGLIGVAVASLGTVAIVNLLRLLQVFFLFRLLPYSLGFLKPVMAGLVTLAIVWGVRQLSPAEMTLVYIAIDVSIFLAIYVGMILLLGLSQEDRAVLSLVGRRISVMLSKRKSVTQE